MQAVEPITQHLAFTYSTTDRVFFAHRTSEDVIRLNQQIFDGFYGKALKGNWLNTGGGDYMFRERRSVGAILFRLDVLASVYPASVHLRRPRTPPPLCISSHPYVHMSC